MIKKKIGIIVGIMIALSMQLSVAFAASTDSGEINGFSTGASSTIITFAARAATLYGSTGSLVVSSDYNYVNITTLTIKTTRKSNVYYSNCEVNFTAPANCYSVQINSSHSVTAYGKTWTVNTSAVY